MLPPLEQRLLIELGPLHREHADLEFWISRIMAICGPIEEENKRLVWAYRQGLSYRVGPGAQLTVEVAGVVIIERGGILYQRSGPYLIERVDG